MARHSRHDGGWKNLVTGLGDAFRDKRLQAELLTDFLRQPQAEMLRRSDDMAQRIVNKIPADALRRGFSVHVRAKPKPKEKLGPVDMQPILAPGATSVPGYIPPDLVQRNPQTDGPPSHLTVRTDAAPLPIDPTGATSNTEDTDQAKEIENKIMARHKALGTRQAIREGAQHERAYGGAAIFLGTVDRSPGRSPNVLSRPLDLRYLEELRFLTVLTPMELVPFRYYGDPLAQNYGKVQLWTMVPKSKGVNPRTSLQRVHESRLVLFPGIRTSRFMIEANIGWGDSVLNTCVNHIRNFSVGYDSASALIGDFSQAVFKMKNLVETLQADDDKIVERRAAAMDMARSVLRAIVIDKDEEFERKSTSVTGLPELLDRLANRLAAATGMPVTMLMGQAPAGLNATGQADRDWYNENVANLQEDRILPALERITEVELNATNGATDGVEPEGWSISLPDLEEPSEVEQADIRLKTSQADALDIDRGVLMPEEVAQSHWSGDKFSPRVILNHEVREAAMTMKGEQDQKEADDQAAQLEAMKQQPKVMPGGKPGGMKPPPKKV
jgi:phage-related protein (TIGR01555 family)